MNDNFFFGSESRKEVYCRSTGDVETLMESYVAGEYTKDKVFNRLQELYKEQVEWIEFPEGDV